MGQMQMQNYEIIFENHRIRQLFKLFLTLCAAEDSSLLRKENGTVRERTWLAKKDKPCKRGKSSLQTGRKVLGNREKGTFWLVAIARPHKLGRAPLHLRAPARLCWSGRQNPIFIPWFRLFWGSTASGGSHAPSTGVDAHPGRGCRDKPWRSRASDRCRSFIRSTENFCNFVVGNHEFILLFYFISDWNSDIKLQIISQITNFLCNFLIPN